MNMRDTRKQKKHDASSTDETLTRVTDYHKIYLSKKIFFLFQFLKKL